MPNPSPHVVSPQRNDAKTVVYFTRDMRAELEARVELADDSSMSRVVRQAVREFFRRHPRTTKP